jgi:nucleoside-diphosphate kinase
MKKVCPDCKSEVRGLQAMHFLKQYGVCTDCKGAQREEFSSRTELLPQAEKHRTFAFIKPAYEGQDFDETTLKILQRLSIARFSIVRGHRRMLTIAELGEHYKKHVHRDFFGPMVEYLTSGPVFLLILEHPEEAINLLRTVIGPTNPMQGNRGEIRYDFGKYTPGVAHLNAIHASDNHEEMVIEAHRFFGEEVAIEVFGEDEVRRVIWEPVSVA